MDFYKVPIGFGMALAMNPNALNTYSAMTEEQKQAMIDAANGCPVKLSLHPEAEQVFTFNWAE